MTAENCWCTWQSSRLICPIRVVRPNWKAECVERRPLRLEGGKGCEALPIATFHPHTHAPAGRAQSLAGDDVQRPLCSRCPLHLKQSVRCSHFLMVTHLTR